MSHRAFAFLAAASLGACQVAPPTAVQTPSSHVCSSSAEREQVAKTVQEFYIALASDDHSSLRVLTTPSFHAFEVGKRFDGAELVKLIADGHRSGNIWQWNVSALDAWTDCNLAFATWENNGASGTRDKMVPRAWLESAVLIRQGNRWAIDFLHSTPRDPRP